MNAARTEHPLTGIERFAGHSLQDDCRRIHSPHFSGFFIHKALDARADAKDLAAERHHFGIEVEASVRKSDVQRRKDFLIGFDPHEVAWPKIEIAPGCRLTARDLALRSGKRNAAGDGLKSIVQRAGRAPPFIAESQRSVIVEQIEEAAGYLRQGSVARCVRIDILPSIPPAERLRIFEQFGSLTGIADISAGILLPCGSHDVALRTAGRRRRFLALRRNAFRHQLDWGRSVDALEPGALPEDEAAGLTTTVGNAVTAEVEVVPVLQTPAYVVPADRIASLGRGLIDAETLTAVLEHLRHE